MSRHPGSGRNLLKGNFKGQMGKRKKKMRTQGREREKACFKKWKYLFLWDWEWRGMAGKRWWRRSQASTESSHKPGCALAPIPAHPQLLGQTNSWLSRYVWEAWFIFQLLELCPELLKSEIFKVIHLKRCYAFTKQITPGSVGQGGGECERKKELTVLIWSSFLPTLIAVTSSLFHYGVSNLSFPCSTIFFKLLSREEYYLSESVRTTKYNRTIPTLLPKKSYKLEKFQGSDHNYPHTLPD